MKSSSDLKTMLASIHRKSYPAYKDLRGIYSFGDYTLSINHVQGDPLCGALQSECENPPEDRRFSCPLL